MPELPEVETIRQQLLPYLPAAILKVSFSKVVSSILKTSMFSPKGKTITRINRKGKLLDFVFNDDTHMISGLGMSGGWRVSRHPVDETHTHIQFACTNPLGRIYFAYVDPRRFGKCHLVDAPTARILLDRLGPDVSTRAFTSRHVAQVCARHPKYEIKPLLLDQAYFSGVGNYMACEILAHSRIHPQRLAGSLTPDEHRLLVKATRFVVTGSIRRQGLTFSGGYVDANGQRGNALSNLVVFHQKTCGLCSNGEIKKITLKGRGTYFCPACQK